MLSDHYISNSLGESCKKYVWCKPSLYRDAAADAADAADASEQEPEDNLTTIDLATDVERHKRN